MLLTIRFHGRGGHGVKTAARIVGTAAFRAAYQAQDAPMYGAERRGAAVSAFVRISDEPILERGPIADPDLIVLADETLLHDPSAGVQRGGQAASAILVNRPQTGSPPAGFNGGGRAVACDISGITREILGRTTALSAGLAAGAVRLTGLISRDLLREAMHDEFAELNIAAIEIAQNIQIGERVFDALNPVPLVPKAPRPAQMLVAATCQSPLLGTPSILHPGNAEQRNTGAWRVERPEVDPAVCTRCGLCFVMCPDGAIRLDEHGYPVIDYDHCKGCLICQRLCPVHAVSRKQETQAW